MVQAVADSHGDRGEETRRRLIEAALPVFGRDGFEGVSTRAIAAAADANVAAIAYHFGGKRGLYLGVAAHLAERHGGVLVPLVARVQAELPRCGASREAVAALVAQVIGGMMRGLGSLREDCSALFLLREMMNPTDAFDVLFEHFFGPMNLCFSRLAGAALGVPADDPQAVVRGHLLLGAVMPLIAGRVVVERRLGHLPPPEMLTAAAVAAACGQLGLPVPADGARQEEA